MNKDVKVLHVAINCATKEKADIFFNTILNMKLKKNFTLSDDLSEKIFGIKKDVEVLVYDNGFAQFEIFIDKSLKNQRFDHICIEVDNKNQFIESCKEYKLNPFFVKKGEKNLLFVRDFSDNLFEIKESI